MVRVEPRTIAGSRETQYDRGRKRYWAALLVVAGAAACAAVWLLSLTSSVWLDEAGTWWVVKDGLARSVSRSIQIQGQSPVYYVVTFLSTKIGGHSELALRLPSLLAMLAAIMPIARLGSKLFDSQTGRLAALTFCATGSMAFAAADARPYALALLVSVSASLYLVRWMETGSRRDRILYIVFAALTVYVHYLYAIVLFAHIPYALMRRRATLRQLISTWTLVGVACIPIVPQFIALLGRSGSLSWSGSPDPLHLSLAVRIPLMVLAAGLVFIAARRAGSKVVAWLAAPFAALLLVTALTPARVVHVLPYLRRARALAIVLAIVAVATAGAYLITRFKRFNPLPALRGEGASLTLLVAWALAAPILTYVISTVTPVKIFAPRYFLSSVPAAALLAAWAIRKMEPIGIRLLVAASLVAAVMATASTNHAPEDWRGAVAIANRATISANEPVLVSTGFIESNQVSWLNDPAKRSFITAPVDYYRLRGRIVVMPFDPVHQAAGYVTERIKDLSAEREFLVVTNKLHMLPQLLRDRLASEGFRAEELTPRGARVRVTRFVRG